MPNVVIVGGGVIGCATAFYLARQGASVTLLERGELAGEASGAAAGMLAALSDEGGDRGPDFQRLCLDSLELYRDLLPELAPTGIDVRYRDSGVLHLALSEDEAAHLKHRFEQQRGLSPDSLWLEGEQIREVEPQASPKAFAAVLSPREHYLDPQRLTLALAAAARNLGAEVRTGVRVSSIELQGGRALSVRTASGRVAGDAVLLAAGPWTAKIAAALGAYVPVRPVRGQMLSLFGPSPPLWHVIWGQKAYLVPRERGQTFLGATVEEAGFRKRNTRTALLRLQRAAAELVPALKGAAVRSAWAGLRPATPDALPIMGRLPGLSNVWVATGHFRNGILLAPRTGQLMADSILAGAPDPALKPFAAERFAD